MHRPVLLLHVVRRNIGPSRQSVQETVLKSKHWSRTHNGRLGEDAAHHSLAPTLSRLAKPFLIDSCSLPWSGKTRTASPRTRCRTTHG